MNRKYMPLILMLAAGAVVCIITFIMDYPMVTRLGALLAVLLIFYILGALLKWILDVFERQNNEIAMEKGEVIEKTEHQEEVGEGTSEEA